MSGVAIRNVDVPVWQHLSVIPKRERDDRGLPEIAQSREGRLVPASGRHQRGERVAGHRSDHVVETADGAVPQAHAGPVRARLDPGYGATEVDPAAARADEGGEGLHEGLPEGRAEKRGVEAAGAPVHRAEELEERSRTRLLGPQPLNGHRRKPELPGERRRSALRREELGHRLAVVRLRRRIVHPQDPANQPRQLPPFPRREAGKRRQATEGLQHRLTREESIDAAGRAVANVVIAIGLPQRERLADRRGERRQVVVPREREVDPGLERPSPRVAPRGALAAGEGRDLENLDGEIPRRRQQQMRGRREPRQAAADDANAQGRFLGGRGAHRSGHSGQGAVGRRAARRAHPAARGAVRALRRPRPRRSRWGWARRSLPAAEPGGARRPPAACSCRGRVR